MYTSWCKIILVVIRLQIYNEIEREMDQHFQLITFIETRGQEADGVDISGLGRPLPAEITIPPLRTIKNMHNIQTVQIKDFEIKVMHGTPCLTYVNLRSP